MTIAVIGGGIVGASAAFHLASSGIDTVLVESEQSGRATSAGAGIISPGSTMRDLPAFFALAQPAVSYYPVLVEALAEAGVYDAGYEVCGQLMVADTPEKAEALPAQKALVQQRLDGGMPNIGTISDVSPAEAQTLLPTLGDVLAAIHLSDAARVDGARMRDAMTKAALNLGARVISGAATLVMDGGKASGIAVGDETIAVDAVVVSAGAWSNTVLAPTGFALPLAPQKGQIIHIDMPEQDTTNWPILTWNSSQYQLCFGPNRVVCGATREFDSGYDTRVTPAGVTEVLNEQLRICPGLAHGTIAEVRVGLRPYADDGVPFIGPVPGCENVIVGSGHGPSGLTLGPYSGLLTAELAQDMRPSVDVSSFRLDRPITHNPGAH